MATQFLTQLIRMALDPGFAEVGETGIRKVPIYAPSMDVYKFEPIADPGMKGRARNDANRFGAAWAEFNFYLELGGFTSYEATGTKYEPPWWGVLCQALGMKKTGVIAAANWQFEVVDTIHLSDDTVHTSEHLTAMNALLELDGFKYILENAIGNATFSMDVTEGPPRLTFDTFMGNIFEDNFSNTYHYPITDMPLSFTPALGGPDACTNAAPDATECTAATATFQTDLVAVGDIAYNNTTLEQAVITVVVSETELTTEAITGNWTAADDVHVFQRMISYDAPVTADVDNITLTVTVIPNDGTYTPVAISNTDFRRWAHNIGNNVVEQRDGTETFKLDQFLVANQNANQATFVVRVPDPGIQSTPATFNPHFMVQRKDLLQLTAVHNTGNALNVITWICDYYISEVIGVTDDGQGVLEYTLLLQQANIEPSGVAAQYFKSTST